VFLGPSIHVKGRPCTFKNVGFEMEFGKPRWKNTNLDIWGHSRLRYYFWVSNEKRTFVDNFTCLVCLDLYCEAYFGSYLHFIFHIEYTDKVNLEGIGSSKISFWFLKGHLGVLSYLFTLGSRNEMDNKNQSKRSQTIIVQVCTNRTKYVLNTNCPTLHVAPNMAKNTYNHGHT
jgi:hypothetical protein